MRLFLIVLLAIPCFLFSQQKDSVLDNFGLKKHALNRRGMTVLSYWGGANIVAGAAGYFTTNKYESRNFYGMTAAWGLINLGIGLPGALSKKTRHLGLFQLQKEQTKVEKIYLSNAMFDLLYISGGAFLKEYAINQSKERSRQQFNGFGDAVLVQGAALLLFDTSMLLLNSRNRKNNLDKYLQNSQICFSLNSIRLRYRF
jgi:uncharacterized protein DUF6992